MKYLYTVSLFALLFSMSCCDKIDNPILTFDGRYQESIYGPAPSFENASSDIYLKNVMIEDFTAHQCGNCPEAAIIASDIHEEHPDRVSVIAIHAGSLAATDDDHYIVDWTCEESEVYFSQLDFQANPLGRINRAPGLGTVNAPADWGARTQEQLDEDPIVVLQMITDFISEENHLNIHVFSEFVQDFGEDAKLAILITESGLVGGQLDYSQDPTFVEEYEFEHLLRGSVTGALGLSVGDDLNDGYSITSSYTFTWPSEWEAANCSVVAFVYDNTSGALLNVIEKPVDE